MFLIPNYNLQLWAQQDEYNKICYTSVFKSLSQTLMFQTNPTSFQHILKVIFASCQQYKQ
jgi:hypothetical protein